MKATIIGTGNVAHHLGKRLFQKGVDIQQVIGRDAQRAAELAEQIEAKYTTYFEAIVPNSDLYIIAVSDGAIEEVAVQLSLSVKHKLVVHTSGSVPSAVLEPYFDNYGTLYPLQTFSKNTQPDFDKIPIFVNATPPQYQLEFLKKIAALISPKVYELSDHDRQTLHIAAVFVNNFTNHLFQIGSTILRQHNLPFEILLPLIEETVNKIRENAPETMQTGPARRGDNATIERHLTFLENFIPPQYELIYKVLSSSINPNLTINKPK
jgi:predicted short-subunit dehydrogenase-like oxidoreductase (DUF2520 family)